MEIKSLAEELLFVTVRIDTVNSHGEKGSGTGFVFLHNYKDIEGLSIVTNKHVIKDAVSGGITFIRKENDTPKLGSSFRLDFSSFEELWNGHPNPDIDIATTALLPMLTQMKERFNVDVYYKYISSSNIPDNAQFQEIDAIEEVVFVGYPNGIWDSKNFTPIIRKGTTATPYTIDFENKKKFLIDASVFGGSSGSPVFIYNSGSYSTKSGGIISGNRLLFLGVVAAVYFKRSINDVISLPIPTKSKDVTVAQEMIDLGIVFKAESIVELIELMIDKQIKTNANN